MFDSYQLLLASLRKLALSFNNKNNLKGEFNHELLSKHIKKYGLINFALVILRCGCA